MSVENKAVEMAEMPVPSLKPEIEGEHAEAEVEWHQPDFEFSIGRDCCCSAYCTPCFLGEIDSIAAEGGKGKMSCNPCLAYIGFSMCKCSPCALCWFKNAFGDHYGIKPVENAKCGKHVTCRDMCCTMLPCGICWLIHMKKTAEDVKKASQSGGSAPKQEDMKEAPPQLG